MRKLYLFSNFILIVAMFCCNSHNSPDCEPPMWKLEKFANQVLFMDSLLDRDSCMFSLRSGYLDEIYTSTMIIEDEGIRVRMSPEADGFQLLFAYGQDPKKINNIDIYHFDWGGEGTNKEVSTSHLVRLLKTVINDDETFFVAIIENLITAFPEVGRLDAVIIYSDLRGFIGSYYYDEKNPNMIIEKRGDILEDLLSYANHDFRVIM